MELPIENRKKAHVDVIANIERMSSHEMTVGTGATELMAIMAKLKSVKIDDTWGDYKDQALLAQASAMKSLEKSISDRIDYEAELKQQVGDE